DQIVDAPDLTLPEVVFPRPANCWHILQPRRLGGDVLDLAVIAELPGAAGAIDEEQFVPFGKFAVALITVEGSKIAHKRSQSGYSRDQQVIGALGLGLQHKASLRHFAHEHFISDLEIV